MRTSAIGIRKRLVDCAQLTVLMGLLLSSPAIADIYPIKGVWVAPNSRFSYRTKCSLLDCKAVRHRGSGSETHL